MGLTIIEPAAGIFDLNQICPVALILSCRPWKKNIDKKLVPLHE